MIQIYFMASRVILEEYIYNENVLENRSKFYEC